MSITETKQSFANHVGRLDACYRGLIRAHNEELMDARQEGYEEGYTEGLEAGFEDGYESGYDEGVASIE